MNRFTRWAPALLFSLGSVLILGVDRQRHMEIDGDLGAALPQELLGLESRDLELAEGEVAVAGMDTYVLRAYGPGDGVVGGDVATGTPPFSVYVGFYGSQAQGRTIHSPKNCLPGSGWEALASREARVTTPRGDVPVNRYLLQRGAELALVLYWYQGRGRVRANEYLVKLDLLRDSALHGRSDEALVRIVVPVQTTEEEAFRAAERVAAEVIPAVDTVLPAF